MLIVDRDVFAIECYHEAIPDGSRSVFGRMCVWAGGHRLGDINEPACMLNVSECRLQSHLRRLYSVDDQSVLRGLSDRDAFDYIDRMLYLDHGKRSDERVSMDWQRWCGFDFLTNGGESFDRTKSFIVGDGESLRILFEDEASGFRSARVPHKVFAHVVQEFLKWVAKESESTC